MPHSLACPSIAELPAVVGLYAAVPAWSFTRCSEAHVTLVAGIFESLSEATEAAVADAAVIELVAIGGR